MRKACIAVSCCLLAACSNFSERHQASGDFDYLDAKLGDKVTVPADLKGIDYQSEYDIPSLEVTNIKVSVGPGLDIRAPMVPMPVAKDSRVVESGKRAEIIFESLKSAEELKTDLWRRINTFLNDNQFAVVSRDDSALATDWLVSQPQFTRLYGLDEDVSLRQKYRFELEVGEHGHSANLVVKLAEHEQSNSSEALDGSVIRRYETQMLNMMLSHLYSNERKQTQERAKIARRGMQLELGFDETGESAYVVKAPFEQAWSKMAQVLPKLGFEVEDRDKTLGMYFVRYEGVESGFWSSLWGDDEVGEIKLEKGKYQVQVQAQGEQAIIGLIDEAGDKLSAEQLTEMFTVFKTVMSKDLL